MRNRQRGGIFFRLLTLLMLILLASVLYLARHPLMRLAGGWWVVDEHPERSDAILVLGDDNFAGDRAAKAAELFRAGMAPLVVASGRMLRPYAGIAELMERDLQARGVPAGAIVRYPERGANTREEGQSLRELVSSRGWRRILLVTSNYHTRRASYIFHKVFPAQVTVLTVAAPDSDYDPERWWETRQGRKTFFLETVAYAEAIAELWDSDDSRATSSAPVTPGPGAASPAPAGK
jgi:uncharacterized SAM-binding protein YcdF (DUF218 family)